MTRFASLSSSSSLRRKLQSSLFHSRERKKDLRREGRFASFVDTPHDLGDQAATAPATTPFVMPAGSSLAVSFSASVTSGDIEISVGSRTIQTPDLTTDQIRRIGYFERDFTLIPTANIAGTMTLYLLDQWNNVAVIAEGTWS